MISRFIKYIAAFSACYFMAAQSALSEIPIPNCDGSEGGMRVWETTLFGYEQSGFTIEHYSTPLNENGLWNAGPGPIRQLDGFLGLRITECRSGKFLAIERFEQDLAGDEKALVATEFLRNKIQSGRQIRLRDVERAAKALYGDTESLFTKQKSRILTLRETEETCGCREFAPGLWKTR